MLQRDVLALLRTTKQTNEQFGDCISQCVCEPSATQGTKCSVLNHRAFLLKDSSKDSIEGVVTHGALCLDPSKLIIFMIFSFLWVCGTLGDILTSIVSKFHFGKPLGARDMILFGLHSLLHGTSNVFLAYYIDASSSVIKGIPEGKCSYLGLQGFSHSWTLTLVHMLSKAPLPERHMQTP